MKTRFEIDDSGQLFRWKPELVHGADAVLAEFARKQPVTAAGLTRDGMLVKVYPSGRTVVFVKMPSITIKTWFSPVRFSDATGEHVRMTPCWAQGESVMAVFTEGLWSPPAGDMLWFAVASDNTTNPNVFWQTTQAPDNVGNKKVFNIPISNVYDDGRVCMGDAWRLGGVIDLERAGLIDVAWAGAKHFACGSVFNMDLRPPKVLSDLLYSFEVVDKEEGDEGAVDAGPALRHVPAAPAEIYPMLRSATAEIVEGVLR